MQTKLIITQGDIFESPREWENLGKFITISNRYYSPDQDDNLIEIIKETADQANDQDHHIKLITKAIKDQGDKVSLIVPITMYDHGGVYYSVGTTRGFDYSNNGFYIVTQSDLERVGLSKWTRKDKLIKTIESEIETYNKYCTGEVYYFELQDLNGEEIDSCGGFYELDDIKEHLPEEYQDLCLIQFIKY